jgi:hypothetical protein
MSNRFAPSSGALGIALTIVLFVPPFVAAQSLGAGANLDTKAPKRGTETAASARAWIAPRTPDGQPDLHGYWISTSFTPLERPAKYKGREFLTAQEAEEVRKAGLQRRTQADPAGTGEPHYDSTAFGLTPFQQGFVPNNRTSLVVDPPDGRIPALTREAEARQKATSDNDNAEAGGSGGGGGGGGGVVHADTAKDLGVLTNCLSMSGGPPILPGGYNNGVYILQNPEYVVLQAEYGTELRIIPVDARPHAGANIRQWHGDGRGHWEGDTLVVETTNFRPEAAFRNGDPKTLKITERFKRVAADRIEYSFTIDDPSTWTKPWTAIVPLQATQGPFFEYACSESNMDVVNIMAGARAAEKAAEEKARGAGGIPISHH